MSALEGLVYGFSVAPQNKFDAEGRLTDETARKGITALLEALADWTRRLAKR